MTDANVNYEGSLTIHRALMDKLDIREHERVLCGNMDNGAGFETYEIAGETGSGNIILNGATAHLSQAGSRK